MRPSSAAWRSSGAWRRPSRRAATRAACTATAPSSRQTARGRPGTDADGRPATSGRASAGLAISAVVALDEDAGRLGFLTAHEGFGRPERIGPLLLFVPKAPRPAPEPVAPGHLRLLLPAGAGGF